MNIIDPAIRTVHPKLGFNDMRHYIIRNTLLYQYAYKVDCGMKALQTICKRKNEQKIKKIRPVIDYLNENNIQYVLIKGLATIFYGYKSLGLRNSGDVDILVHPSQADALYETLITQFQAKQMAGYIQSYKLLTQHYPPLIINDVCFELHFRLNHYCELVNSSCEFILNNPQIVTYESLTFKIPDIECHFIILCHHLYRDECLDQNYCLRRHSDVLYFWAACEKYIDIPRLLFLSNIKGDNNTCMDAYLVCEDDIIGVADI